MGTAMYRPWVCRAKLGGQRSINPRERSQHSISGSCGAQRRAHHVSCHCNPSGGLRDRSTQTRRCMFQALHDLDAECGQNTRRPS
jgi:hypothetical protein